MITLDEARKIVMDTAYALGTEKTDLQHCLGRVLAEEVISDMDMPPFDKSAMDGFACRRDDLGQALEVVIAASGNQVLVFQPQVLLQE